ncbi:MAG: DNA polymerase III subunit alpha, partial [Anaerolineae bacterium]|nr:DNA polymerase III subunit alpha [Anaerolineae bacterium]
FLIVWDLCEWAARTDEWWEQHKDPFPYDDYSQWKENDIWWNVRGSGAGSVVAYTLGITSIDPLAHELLFERFLSEDKFTMPDIDIDFAADRREEVIRYVYDRYGAAHTAMVCNIVTYRARSALRDLGKALDLPDSVIDRLARSLDTHSPREAASKIEAGLEAESPPHHPLRLLAGLMRQIEECPRHLSIHSGGMLITGPPLDSIVPLEPATMPGRVICQWDKDSVEDAGLIKIDLLALRTLGLVSEAEELIRQMGETPPDLDGLPLDDPAIFAMLARGDTIGAFQVESRAQQQMLPRLKPQCFEDIAVEIAIVRPGPIQGGAVHPYLRRRTGQEDVAYLH